MIRVNVLPSNPVHIEVGRGGNIPVSVPDYKVIIKEAPKYSGAYIVTPDAEPITLATNDRLMTDNVTINAIPNNYGKITWNGSVLTVS